MTAIRRTVRRLRRLPQLQPLARTAMHFGMVYATAGVVGVGALAWETYRSRRAKPKPSDLEVRDADSSLSAAA